MCGIVGVFSKKQNHELWFSALAKANDALIKRGPDAGNISYWPHAALAHRRLSIIDTSVTANQPMIDSSGRFAIIFNGEIFNFSDLKNELIKRGIVFHTSSDTEVLLQLYKFDLAKDITVTHQT